MKVGPGHVSRAALSLIVAVLCLTALAPIRAMAQADSLTIEDAIAFARQNHPTLVTLRGERTTAVGQVKQITPIQLPTITYFREGIEDGGFGEQKWSLGAQIVAPTDIVYGRRKARSVVGVSDARVERALREVVAAVRTGFVESGTAIELLTLADEELELAESLLDIVVRREAGGEASMLDVMRTRVEVAAARSRKDRAALAVKNAKAHVLAAAGIRTQSRLQPVVPHPKPEVIIDIDTAYVRGLLPEHPAAMELDHAMAAARAGLARERAGLVPDVTASVFRQDFGSGYDAYGFDVGLRLRIPFTPAYRGRIEAARGAVDVARGSRLAFDVELDLAVESAIAAIRSAEAVFENLGGSTQDDIASILQLSLAAYNQGEASLSDVVAARSTAVAARTRYISAIRDYHVRVVELDRITGSDYFNALWQ